MSESTDFTAIKEIPYGLQIDLYDPSDLESEVIGMMQVEQLIFDAGLSPRQREMLLYTVFLGLSTGTASEALGIAYKTGHRSLTRAHDRLAAYLYFNPDAARDFGAEPAETGVEI